MVEHVNEVLVSHPFKNRSVFEVIKHICLSPSLNTPSGMDLIVDGFQSGQMTESELGDFRSARELQLLDDFAATSPIAGGPWKAGSVAIKMPCPRANKPSFSTEDKAPDFKVHGIQYCSLVDLIISKVQEPSTSKSFITTPFTEWWCPPGAVKPIRIYGEAYSSDIVIKLYEDVK